MSNRRHGDKILEGIEQNRRPHHDTIYCNERHKSAILQAINGPTLLGASGLKVNGLRVHTNEGFKHPIVCKKGEIFTLVRDFKYE